MSIVLVYPIKVKVRITFSLWLFLFHLAAKLHLDSATHSTQNDWLSPNASVNVQLIIIPNRLVLKKGLKLGLKVTYIHLVS